MANPSTPEEFTAWLDKQADLLDREVISQQEYNDAVNDVKAGMVGYSAQLRATTTQLKKSFMELGSSIVKGEEGANVYNNSINSAADAVDSFASRFGIIGKIIGGLATAGAKYATAVNDQADALFKNYKELSRNGLATGMQDTFENLQSMGYTAAEIGKMGDLMKENSSAFANFGGTAATGAKQFATAAKEIQFSDLGTQFKQMGMTTDDINKGMAAYIKTQQQSGVSSKQISENLAASAADYMLSQDKLTKLTGISADKQNEILDAAKADQRFAAVQGELERKGDKESLDLAKRNRELLVKINNEAGPKVAKGFQDFLSGNLNSPDAQKFARIYGNAADNIKNNITNQDVIMDNLHKDAKTASLNWNNQAKAGNADQYMNSFVENQKLAGQALGQAAKDKTEAAEAEQDAQRAGADAAVKGQVKIRNAQRNQTQVTDLAINKGIIPVTKSMAALSETIESATDVVGKLAGRESKLGNKAVPGPASSSGSSSSSAAPPSVTSPQAKAAEASLMTKLTEGGITGKTAQANILANVQAESGNFLAKSENLKYTPEQLFSTFPKYFKSLEDATQVAAQGPEAIGNRIYGGRNGNAADEGYKYRGRGLIQLTGKDNYAKYGKMIGVDLVKDPDLASQQDIAEKIAVAYFKDKQATGTNLNDINSVGKAVGYTGGQNETDKRYQMSQNIQKDMPTAPRAATGGVLSGPKGGYEAMLHGTEAVIPLPSGQSIPVQMNGGGSSTPPEQLAMLAQELGKLEMLVRIVQKNNDITTRILQRHS